MPVKRNRRWIGRKRNRAHDDGLPTVATVERMDSAATAKVKISGAVSCDAGWAKAGGDLSRTAPGPQRPPLHAEDCHLAAASLEHVDAAIAANGQARRLAHRAELHPPVSTAIEPVDDAIGKIGDEGPSSRVESDVVRLPGLRQISIRRRLPERAQRHALESEHLDTFVAGVANKHVIAENCDAVRYAELSRRGSSASGARHVFKATFAHVETLDLLLTAYQYLNLASAGCPPPGTQLYTAMLT